MKADNHVFAPSLDLQLFADDEVNPIIEYMEMAEAGETSAEEVTSHDDEEQITEDDDSVVEESAVETPEEASETERLKAILNATPGFDKFGGDVEKFVKSYQEGQRAFTQRSQELAELKRELEAMKAQSQSEPPNAEQVAMQTGRESGPNEQEMEKFWDNPREYINSVIDAEVKNRLQPHDEFLQNAIAEREYDIKVREAENSVAEFSDRHPDVDLYRDAMVSFVEGAPPEIANLEAGLLLEMAYFYTKGKNTQSEIDIFNNPSEERVRAAYGTELGKKLVAEHLSNVKASNMGAPTVMGEGSGGTAPAQQPKEPTTFEEAKRQILASFGG